MSKSYTVADHCRVHALSSPKDEDYKTVWGHNHDDICDRCISLSSVISEIEQALKQPVFSTDVKEELAFITAHAKKNVNPWI